VNTSCEVAVDVFYFFVNTQLVEELIEVLFLAITVLFLYRLHVHYIEVSKKKSIDNYSQILKNIFFYKIILITLLKKHKTSDEKQICRIDGLEKRRNNILPKQKETKPLAEKGCCKMENRKIDVAVSMPVISCTACQQKFVLMTFNECAEFEIDNLTYMQEKASYCPYCGERQI